MKDGTYKTIQRTDQLLGMGAEGRVYKGIDKDGQEYAIKLLKHVQNDQKIFDGENFVEKMMPEK